MAAARSRPSSSLETIVIEPRSNAWRYGSSWKA